MSLWRVVAVLCTVAVAAPVVRAKLQTHTAQCHEAFVFDSTALRSEFASYAAPDATANVFGASATALRIQYRPGAIQDPRVPCVFMWAAPVPPFVSAYHTQATSGQEDREVLRYSGDLRGLVNTFLEASRFPRISLQVASVSHPECVPVVSSSQGLIVYNRSLWIDQARAGRMLYVEDPASSAVWLRTLDIAGAAVTGTSTNASAATAGQGASISRQGSGRDGARQQQVLVLNDVGFPLYLALPRVGCEAVLYATTTVETMVPWFLWVWPSIALFLALCIDVTAAASSLYHTNTSRVHGGWLFAVVIFNYFAIQGCLAGLAAVLAHDQHTLAERPLSPGAIFFLCCIIVAVAALTITLWRLQFRSLVATLVLKLLEHSFALALSIAFWLRGWFVLGIISLAVIVIGNLVMVHLFSVFQSVVPDRLSHSLPWWVKASMWFPLTIPIAPMFSLYAQLFVSRADGDLAPRVTGLFDTVVSSRTFIVLALPQLVLQSLALALHPPMILFFVLFFLATVWSQALGLRRYARVVRQWGLEYEADVSLWTALERTVDEYVAQTVTGAHHHRYAVDRNAVDNVATAVAHHTHHSRSRDRGGSDADVAAARSGAWRHVSPERATHISTLYDDATTGQRYVVEHEMQPADRAEAQEAAVPSAADVAHDARRQAAMNTFQHSDQPHHNHHHHATVRGATPQSHVSDVYSNAGDTPHRQHQHRPEAYNPAGPGGGTTGFAGEFDDPVYPTVRSVSSPPPAAGATPTAADDDDAWYHNGRHGGRVAAVDSVANRELALAARVRHSGGSPNRAAPAHQQQHRRVLRPVMEEAPDPVDFRETVEQNQRQPNLYYAPPPQGVRFAADHR